MATQSVWAWWSVLSHRMASMACKLQLQSADVGAESTMIPCTMFCSRARAGPDARRWETTGSGSGHLQSRAAFSSGTRTIICMQQGAVPSEAVNRHFRGSTPGTPCVWWTIVLLDTQQKLAWTCVVVIWKSAMSDDGKGPVVRLMCTCLCRAARLQKLHLWLD
jgi:hypothetical protein